MRTLNWKSTWVTTDCVSRERKYTTALCRGQQTPPRRPSYVGLWLAYGSGQRLLQVQPCPGHVHRSSFRGILEGASCVWWAFSHPTSDARTLAAMQDAVQVGLSCMPPVEPAIASLILAPDEALRPDARCPRPQCRVWPSFEGLWCCSTHGSYW